MTQTHRRTNRTPVLAGACFGGVMLAAVFSAHAARAASNPATAGSSASAGAGGDSILVAALDAELKRAMSSLGSDAPGATQPKPYFLSYDVSDASQVAITAEYGAITSSNERRIRTVDIEVRIGTPAEDNTHGDHRTSALATFQLPLTDDRDAIARSLWFATYHGYGRALDGYLKVKTEQQVRAKEEDASPDFSSEAPVTGQLPAAPPLAVDRPAWEQRLRAISAVFSQYPDVFADQVEFEASSETDYFVSSEGTRVDNPSHTARLVIVGRTRAADGMDMFRDETFEADSAAHLPDQKAIEEKTAAMAKDLEALRVAPITEPFSGPAILSGRAAAVFFHEVLGHRLEGQRQRGDDEGQTFTKLIGKPILPSFISVADDPTLSTFDGTWLSGHYDYDDEGQPARRVELVKDGVLENFLNGHGRAETGHMPTGRQGNLIVSSSKTVPESELRAMLIAEAKRQGKPYGLYFADISSGEALTTRRSPQAFQEIPLVVYRVYVDGRPDELVRGVSIVGTPQAALNSIVATGNRQEVFNGICGAESGNIPVSAVAPAMLVSQIETQRQPQGVSRPPILPPPGPGGAAVQKGAN